MRRSWKALAAFGGAVAAAALPGAWVTSRSLGWYRRLERPSWTPPDALFGPVWTALYATVAASGYRVWRASPSRARSRALALWAAQLALNGAWTPLFFGAHRPRAALADLGLLLAAIGAYASQAAKVDRPAAWMMAPYGAWCAFATALNADIVIRN